MSPFVWAEANGYCNKTQQCLQHELCQPRSQSLWAAPHLLSYKCDDQRGKLIMGQAVIKTNKLHTHQREPQHLHLAQAKSAFLWVCMLQFKLLLGAWSRCILRQHFKVAAGSADISGWNFKSALVFYWSESPQGHPYAAATVLCWLSPAWTVQWCQTQDVSSHV